MSPSKPIKIYCWLLAGLTAFVWALSWFNGHVLNLEYPYDWPIFDPDWRYTDLTDYYDKIRHLAAGGPALAKGDPLYNYPAPALFILFFFIRLFPDPVIAYLTFGAVVWVASFVLLHLQLRALHVTSRLTHAALILTCLCSYPLLFTLDRGNLEIVVFAFVLGGFACLLSGSYWPSAIFFALAVCIKPFPMLFFYPLLTRRKYSQIVLSGAIIVGLNVLALHWLGPTIPVAYASVKLGFARALDEYMLSYREFEIHFDHCFFSCVKQAIRLYHGWPEPIQMRKFLPLAYGIYIPSMGLLVVGCVYYFWRKPLLNQLFAFTILVITTPPLSTDYTLLDVYLIWGLLLIHLLTDGLPVRRALTFLVPLAFLMTAQSYMRTEDMGFGGQFKALLLLFLLLATARMDLKSSVFDRFGRSDAPDSTCAPVTSSAV